MHKWMEEWYDTILYIIFISGLLLFFLYYWGAEYRLQSAELVIGGYLERVSSEGKADRETYEELKERVKNINRNYQLNIYAVEYVLRPVYDYVSEEEITEYFTKRNFRKEKNLPEWNKPEDESTDMPGLQLETNASILAAEQAVLPLPEANETERIEAMRPYQEVYVGDELITVCRVFSGEKSYYAMAETVRAKESGTIELNLTINGELFSTPVNVLCHPRYMICKNGHKVVNKKEIIEEIKATGKFSCPYCAAIPENVKCSTVFVEKRTGTGLTKEEIFLSVDYMDGESEIITPESEGWEDTFDELYCGIQTVQISYRGFTELITVVTENDTCKKCGGACNERNREDYNRFPYCTACMSEVALYTGEVYEEEIHTELFVLMNSMKEKEIILKKGDFIAVQLSEEEKTVSLLQKEILRDGYAGEGK